MASSFYVSITAGVFFPSAAVMNFERVVLLTLLRARAVLSAYFAQSLITYVISLSPLLGGFRWLDDRSYNNFSVI